MKKILPYFWHHKKQSAIVIIVIAILIFFLTPKNAPSIQTQQVKRQDIVQSITTSGKIESQTTATLAFQTPGKLAYVGARKGDFVKAGQTIAALDTRTVQKNLENQLKDYMLQRNTFDQTQQNNQNRTPTQALNDDMKRILENNQYNLDKAVISVELQSLAQEQSYLTTPIDGIVTQADADVVGENAALTSIYKVADPDHVKFTSEVDESEIGNVRPGMPVKMTLESYPDNSPTLTVTKIDFISHTSANGGNVFNVEAAIPDNTGYRYRIGMTGDSEIIAAQKKDVLTVPLGSITDDKYVYVKTPTGFDKRKVVLGIQSDTDREIVSGLKEGEEVALSPDDAAKAVSNGKKFVFF